MLRKLFPILMHLWPSIRKHVLSTKAFFRGFEVTLKPWGFETLWKRFWNSLETLENPLETLLKRSETLLKRFETLLKRFETLWKPFWNVLKRLGSWKHFGNPLEMFRILFEKPLWKCRGKNYSCSLRLLSTCWRIRESTACYVHIFFFAEMSICRMIKVPMKWKIFCAYLKGLSKYRRMAFFFLKYLFSF